MKRYVSIPSGKADNFIIYDTIWQVAICKTSYSYRDLVCHALNVYAESEAATQQKILIPDSRLGAQDVGSNND